MIPARIDDDVALAIKKYQGALTFAARDLGMELTDLEALVRNTPEYRQAVRDGREQLLDMAEQCLVAAIQSGDSKAAQFALKTLGGNRGWREENNVQILALSPTEQLNKVRRIFGVDKDLSSLPETERKEGPVIDVEPDKDSSGE